jgi:hypothetical protein
MKWYTLPELLPVDQDIVWIRLNYWFGEPCLAVFNLTTLTFTTINTSVIYPTYSINRWRNVLAYEYAALGNLSIGATIISSNIRRATPVIVPANCQVLKISIYHGIGSGSLICGLYANGVDNKPSTLYQKSAIVPSLAAIGWQTVDLILPVTFLVPTNVWLSWCFENLTNHYYDALNLGGAFSSDLFAAGMPVNFGPSTTTNRKYSSYLTVRTW